MTREINKNWEITYKNELKQIHHEHNRPAEIIFNGIISFRQNNKFDRKRKPCNIYPDGSLFYWENNKLIEKIKP